MLIFSGSFQTSPFSLCSAIHHTESPQHCKPAVCARHHWLVWLIWGLGLPCIGVCPFPGARWAVLLLRFLACWFLRNSLLSLPLNPPCNILSARRLVGSKLGVSWSQFQPPYQTGSSLNQRLGFSKHRQLHTSAGSNTHTSGIRGNAWEGRGNV